MKKFWKLFPAICVFLAALSGTSQTLAETREQLFEKFNRTAERAEDALSRGEASNESLGVSNESLGVAVEPETFVWTYVYHNRCKLPINRTAPSLSDANHFT